MKIQLLSTALDDLELAKHFYEMQEAGIGNYFLKAIFSEIDQLEFTAAIHKKIYGFHRKITKKFPYAVYYKVDHSNVVIYRILDMRFSPQKIRQLLKNNI